MSGKGFALHVLYCLKLGAKQSSRRPVPCSLIFGGLSYDNLSAMDRNLEAAIAPALPSDELGQPTGWVRKSGTHIGTIVCKLQRPCRNNIQLLLLPAQGFSQLAAGGHYLWRRKKVLGAG